MKAIILAAGTGSRLLNATREKPKALITVHNKPLVDYALTFAEEVGCDECVVVAGFYFAQVQSWLTGRQGVVVAENADFLKGSILTLMKALPLVNDSFLLMNVDHIYPSRLARRLSAELGQYKNISSAVDFDRVLHEDDMKVLLDNKSHIAKISKTISDFQAGYIGLTYVPQPSLRKYRSAADRTASDQTSNVERVLQQLCDEGAPPAIINVSGTRWLEVDNQNDLANAERILTHVPDFLS